eukprot:3634438-Alexandrium_andersonii.AAC.1
MCASIALRTLAAARYRSAHRGAAAREGECRGRLIAGEEGGVQDVKILRSGGVGRTRRSNGRG